jgi:hypothetical protein
MKEKYAMPDFNLPDDPAMSSDAADSPEEEDELQFNDNGKPANYLFVAVDDPGLGPAVAVVPAEYWDAESSMADWLLQLEVMGFTQEAEGMYTYDSSDNVKVGALLEVLHRKFEKLGAVFSEDLAVWFHEECDAQVYRAP